MDELRLKLLPVVLVFLLAEVLWSRIRKQRVFNAKESACNIGIMIANNLVKIKSVVWAYAVFVFIQPLQSFVLPKTGWAFLLTFLIVDCAYYWYHRFNHVIPVLWTMHHVHHSSPWLNLTTAFRLSWLANFVGPLYFAPFLLLGLDPQWLAASLALGLFYQYFLHTQAIGKLGWFEGKLLNTPSAHRVHHGSNDRYIDKNYAGALIIWDRLFGTYQEEEEPVVYGVTTGFVSHNPLVIQFRPLWLFVHGRWRREKDIRNSRSVELLPPTAYKLSK
jgi:sterol desaturase/sphingolipid hydroxylase (fatty acid hydroxylase superfamily)